VTSERRRFPRLRSAVQIRYREVHGDAFPGEQSEGLTVNISGGGVCFSASQPIEPGRIIAVEMNLPDFEAPVVTLGRAAWCEEAGDAYEIGVEFWWIGWGDPEVQRSIGDYIRRALESS
jgi:hypothetical protein